ncbi:hypothetical protein QFZ44_000636 [Pantoea agglomerans]|nr:hypothetical protein [Pantoea agglomerans]
MSNAAADIEAQLIEDIGAFTHDPYGYALYAFPWGEEGTDLAHSKGPRQWQAETFQEIGDHLQNPATRHQPLMIARASGHGIGKSAFISMITKWGMDTCEDCKVVVTANTENQLRTKTWPEIAKWQRLSITKDWFTSTKTAIYSNESSHAEAWRADAVPWVGEQHRGIRWPAQRAQANHPDIRRSFQYRRSGVGSGRRRVDGREHGDYLDCVR